MRPHTSHEYGDNLNNGSTTPQHKLEPLLARARRSALPPLTIVIQLEKLSELFATIFGEDLPWFTKRVEEFLKPMMPPSLKAALIVSTVGSGVEALPDGIEALQHLPADFKVPAGFTFSALLSGATECKDGDLICGFIRDVFGPDADLRLGMSIGFAPSIKLSVALGNVAIAPDCKCPRKASGLEVTNKVPGCTYDNSLQHSDNVDKVRLDSADLFLEATGTGFGAGLQVKLMFDTMVRDAALGHCKTRAPMQPVFFGGRLYVKTGLGGLQIGGELRLIGTVYKAFGLSWLHFADLAFGMALTAPVTIPSAITAGGLIKIGEGCYTRLASGKVVPATTTGDQACISLQAAVNIDAMMPLKTYFAARIEGLAVDKMIKVFLPTRIGSRVNKLLPKVLKDSGFVGTSTCSYAAGPNAVTLSGKSIPMGIYMNGRLRLLGYELSAVVAINPPAGSFKIDVQMSPLTLANGLFQFKAAGADGCVMDGALTDPVASKVLEAACKAISQKTACVASQLACKWNEANRGPTFFADVQLFGKTGSFDVPKPYVAVKISGAITIFGTTAEASLAISNTHYRMNTALTQVFGMKEVSASLLVVADYADLSKAGFRVSGTIVVKNIIDAILKGISVAIGTTGRAIEFIFKDGGVVHAMEKALGSVRSAGKYAHELPFGRYVGSAIISTKTALDAFVKLLFNKIPTYEKGGKGAKAPTAAQNKEGTMTVRTIDSLEDFIKLIRDMARVVAGNIIGVAEAVSSRSASKILEFSAMFDVSAGSHGAALELAATTAFFGQNGSFAFSIRPGQAFADLVKVIGAKIIEVAAPAVNKVGGIVQNTKDAAQGIADKAKFKCDATCEAVFINTWNNGVKPVAQTFVSVFQTGATFVADVMMPAVQAIVSPLGRLDEIAALSATVAQLEAGAIKTLAQTMTGALTTALASLKLHEAIALAAKCLMGGMKCAPDKTTPIPKKYTNMYSTGNKYKIFAQDGIPMAGPNCEYAAIIGTKGVPQTVEGTVSWKVKPTGLFQWMEDMKTKFTSQVAAMALPTLKNVDFAFDFSDLSSIQTKFVFKLCHKNQSCSQVAAAVGGSKKRRARRARTKLPLRKSECLLTLKDECGTASEQTEAGCSTCTQQQPSKLAFVTAGCTDSEVTAYCQGFASAHTVARTRRDSKTGCGSTIWVSGGASGSAPYYTFTDVKKATVDFNTFEFVQGETYTFIDKGVKADYPFNVVDSSGGSGVAITGSDLGGVRDATIKVVISSSYTAQALRYQCTKSSHTGMRGPLTVDGTIWVSSKSAGGYTFTNMHSAAIDFASYKFHKGTTYTFVDKGVASSSPFIVADSSSGPPGVRITGVNTAVRSAAEADKGAGYTYWRFEVVKDGHNPTAPTGDYSCLQAFRFVDKDGNTPHPASVEHANGVPYSSSYNDDTLANVFNVGGTSNRGSSSAPTTAFWCAKNKIHITATFAKPLKFEKYKFALERAPCTNDPQVWTISGSNDKSKWVALLTEDQTCTKVGLDKTPKYGVSPLVHSLGEWNEFRIATKLVNPPESARTFSSSLGDAAPGKKYASSMLDSASGWSPKTAKGIDDWLRIDLGAPMKVVGVVTQGRDNTATQYTRDYEVLTSVDGSTFVTRGVFMGNEWRR